MADHRCQNTTDLIDQGEHFMYDYDVQLSDQLSKSKSSKSSSGESSSHKESSSESWNSDKYGPRDADSEQFNKKMNALHGIHA